MQDLASTSLQGMLEQEQGWEKQEAADFSQWLLPMLALDPQVRASAGAAASHPFLGLELRRARTLGRMEEYKHITEPGLPTLCVKMADTLMEEVFDKIAKKGLCSGKDILKFTGECGRISLQDLTSARGQVFATPAMAAGSRSSRCGEPWNGWWHWGSSNRWGAAWLRWTTWNIIAS